MRRMYSEQELTNVIKAVFEQELEDGALDENVADAVDAYLVEHPVDITALEGQDVELNSLDATGLITGGEIVEKMSGYSCVKIDNTGYTLEPVYAGAVKNGNKITFVFAFDLTKTSGDATLNPYVGQFTIPEAIWNKLYTTYVGSYYYLDNKVLKAFSGARDAIDSYAWLEKVSLGLKLQINTSNFVVNTKYYLRYEVTFLLSDNLISE